MVVLPMLKGGRIENRWQPMSALTWCGPELALDQLHRAEDRPLRAAGAEAGRPRMHAVAQRLARARARHRRRSRPTSVSGITLRTARRHRQRLQAAVALAEGARALQQFGRGVFAGHRQHVLAVQRGGRAGLAQDGREVLLDEVGLAFLHHQHRALAFAEAQHLAVDHRVGDVHHVERHLRCCRRRRPGPGARARAAACCSCRPAR